MTCFMHDNTSNFLPEFDQTFKSAIAPSTSTSFMSDKKNFSIPSELRLSQKWDSTIENFITRPALGLAIGGLFGVVAFSKFYHLSCDSLAEFFICNGSSIVDFVHS